MQNNYLNEYKKILLKIEKLNCIGITPAYAEEISNEFAPLYALEEQYSKMLFLEETDDFKEILNLKSKIEKLETNVFKKGR
jgi:hypothetical protein